MDSDTKRLDNTNSFLSSQSDGYSYEGMSAGFSSTGPVPLYDFPIASEEDQSFHKTISEEDQLFNTFSEFRPQSLNHTMSF